MDQIYHHALKLLAGRDYSVANLRSKLEKRFGSIPQELIDALITNGFLDDTRFAETYVNRRRFTAPRRLRTELESHGVPAAVIDAVLARTDSPSLDSALKAKMKLLKLRAPLQSRDAARLFRAAARLGYDEDAISEAIEDLHDEQ